MTLVWLSSGLPADRSELAAALPSAFSLVPPNPAADPNTPADVGVLPVGSLCVATVFETALLAQLADRPAGVGLLVIGPTAAAGVTAASSVPELAAAIQHAARCPGGCSRVPDCPATFRAGLGGAGDPPQRRDSGGARRAHQDSAAHPADRRRRCRVGSGDRRRRHRYDRRNVLSDVAHAAAASATSVASSPGVNFLAALELAVLAVRAVRAVLAVLAVRPVLVVRAPPSARPRPGKSWPASAGRGSRFRPTNCSRTPVIPSCSRPSSPASSSCAVAPPAQSQVGHSPVTERPPNLMA